MIRRALFSSPSHHSRLSIVEVTNWMLSLSAEIMNGNGQIELKELYGAPR